MKEWLNMKIYAATTAFFLAWPAVYIVNRYGGETAKKEKSLDIKSIRQNPTSFRQQYMPRILVAGGK